MALMSSWRWTRQFLQWLIYLAYSATSKAYNSSWHDAARRQFADDYWEAMKLEIATLENIDAWSVVDR